MVRLTHHKQNLQKGKFSAKTTSFYFYTMGSAALHPWLPTFDTYGVTNANSKSIFFHLPRVTLRFTRGYRHLTPTASQMQIQYPFYYTTGYYRLVKQMCPNFAFRNIFAPSARLYSMFYPSALKATLHPWLSTFDTYGVANNFIPCLSPYGKYIRVL